jgi:hypothetical protein
MALASAALAGDQEILVAVDEVQRGQASMTARLTFF